MIIAVIGHLVLDEIHTLEGAVHESLGGIAFPLAAFAAIADNCDRILPVFPIGEDAVGRFQEEYPHSGAVSDEYIYRVAAPNTRVRLYHESLSHYNTFLVATLETIPFECIEPALQDADLVYINMMTGEDVVPATLERIRNATQAQIYLDLHMIAYTTEHNGTRHLSAVGNWNDWAKHVDILQCNELECSNFIPGYSSEAERVEAIFDAGTAHTILITKGEEGADIYFRDGTLCHAQPVTQPNPVDPTGCGDVFGSVFAYIYALGKDTGRAARLAAHAASYVVGIPGSLGIAGLKHYLDSIQ